MARILYGVMGNTHGHVVRSSTLAAGLRQQGHEFFFVGGGRVPEALSGEYDVMELPVLRTRHKNQKVDIPATIGHIISCSLGSPKWIGKIHRLMEKWQPDVAIVDREFFLPIACKVAGFPCISIDHSHVMKACQYPVPRSQLLSWSLAMLNDYALFDFTSRNLAVSFFHPPKVPGCKDELLPPVLRPAVTEVTPSQGDHILVYQTSPTFGPLIEALGTLKRPVIVYGFKKQEERQGNIHFKAYSAKGILEDLASCAFCVANGGHNLLCEALYYGKPVLSFPIAMLFEQFINADHLQSLGFGRYSTTLKPDPSLFTEFERDLDFFRANIAKHNFNGTKQVVQRVHEIVSEYEGGIRRDPAA